MSYISVMGEQQRIFFNFSPSYLMKHSRKPLKNSRCRCVLVLISNLCLCRLRVTHAGFMHMEETVELL